MHKKLFRHVIPVLVAACLLCLSPARSLGQESISAAAGGLNAFKLGMSMRNVEKIGARRTSDPARLQAEVPWGGASWETHLIFSDNALASVIMIAPATTSLRTLVLEEMAERGYLPLSVERDYTTVALDVLAASGKNAEECRAAMHRELHAFAAQKDGECTVLFGPPALFKKLVRALRNNEDKDAVLARNSGEVLYALQLDKEEDTISVIMSTVKTLKE